jgi:hypothetical protein
MGCCEIDYANNNMQSDKQKPCDFCRAKIRPLLLAADAGRYAPSPSQSIFTRLKQD